MRSAGLTGYVAACHWGMTPGAAPGSGGGAGLAKRDDVSERGLGDGTLSSRVVPRDTSAGPQTLLGRCEDRRAK